jgi:hypothetical protein
MTDHERIAGLFRYICSFARPAGPRGPAPATRHTARQGRIAADCPDGQNLGFGTRGQDPGFHRHGIARNAASERFLTDGRTPHYTGSDMALSGVGRTCRGLQASFAGDWLRHTGRVVATRSVTQEIMLRVLDGRANNRWSFDNGLFCAVLTGLAFSNS